MRRCSRSSRLLGAALGLGLAPLLKQLSLAASSRIIARAQAWARGTRLRYQFGPADLDPEIRRTSASSVAGTASTPWRRGPRSNRSAVHEAADGAHPRNHRAQPSEKKREFLPLVSGWIAWILPTQRARCWRHGEAAGTARDHAKKPAGARRRLGTDGHHQERRGSRPVHSDFVGEPVSRRSGISRQRGDPLSRQTSSDLRTRQ